MKILLIASLAKSLINFRGPLITALQARGFKVHVAAPDLPHASPIRLQLQAAGVVVHEVVMQRTGINPLADILTLWSLWRLMGRVRPDHVLAYTIKPVIYGTLAAWLASVPLRFAMIEGLGFVFTDGIARLSFQRRVLKAGVQLLYKLALSKARRVVFLNPDDLAEFVTYGLLPQANSYLLGGIGVDLANWVPAPSPVQPVTFVVIARLLREKGVVEFADAARVIKQSHPEARFILLGDIDPNPGSLPQELVQGWVDEGLLEWPGHVPVAPWLEQASVYVLPSYREGVPMSTQEAMAMGLAVITTDVPGCRETVLEGVNGFMVPVRNAQALAAAMRKFIDQPDLIEQMGRESRRLAEERFDVHKVNSRLIELMISCKNGDSNA